MNENFIRSLTRIDVFKSSKVNIKENIQCVCVHVLLWILFFRVKSFEPFNEKYFQIT